MSRALYYSVGARAALAATVSRPLSLSAARYVNLSASQGHCGPLSLCCAPEKKIYEILKRRRRLTLLYKETVSPDLRRLKMVSIGLAEDIGSRT